MKSKFCGLIFLLIISFGVQANEPVKIMQYNLYAWNAMTLNKAGAGLVNKIVLEDPDFLTIEEGADSGNTLNSFGLPETYQLAKNMNAAVGIYYKPSKWKLISDVTETQLKSQDIYGPRYVRGALFERYSDKKRIYVYATHWSLCGYGKAFEGCTNGFNQKDDAKIVGDFINNRSDKAIPVILGGDLNVDKYAGPNGENSAPVIRLKYEYSFKDTFRELSKNENLDGNTNTNENANFKIDYIFVKDGNIKKIKTTDAYIKNGFPSDHRYVTATIEFIE